MNFNAFSGGHQFYQYCPLTIHIAGKIASNNEIVEVTTLQIFAVLGMTISMYWDEPWHRAWQCYKHSLLLSLKPYADWIHHIITLKLLLCNHGLMKCHTTGVALKRLVGPPNKTASAKTNMTTLCTEICTNIQPTPITHCMWHFITHGNRVY